MYAGAGQLADSLGHPTVQNEEEQVAQEQAEEDLRTFGTRPEPADAINLDEDEQLSRQARQRRTSDYDRDAKCPKTARPCNEEGMTAIDWNAGESPIMAWVNQSALPAAIAEDTSQTDLPLNRGEKVLQQEKQEIEIFKNVHLDDAAGPANNAKLAASSECTSDLDFGAQIYYRNIVDRYPMLPPYLARRLAIANRKRAERLQDSRCRQNALKSKTLGTAFDPSSHRYSPVSWPMDSEVDNASDGPLFMWEGDLVTASHQHNTLIDQARRRFSTYEETVSDLKRVETDGMVLSIKSIEYAA